MPADPGSRYWRKHHRANLPSGTGIIDIDRQKQVTGTQRHPLVMRDYHLDALHRADDRRYACRTEGLLPPCPSRVDVIARAAYGSRAMRWEDIDSYAQSLAGCKRRGPQTRPAWYVQNRLVARPVDSTTLLVRVPMDQRDALIERFPDSFGIPPRYEAHHKLDAYLEQVDDAALMEAIHSAWESQRSW